MGTYKNERLRIGSLAVSPHGVRSQNLIFCFQVREAYFERDLENMLQTFERRGAHYEHEGEGKYRLTVPSKFSWIPFYDTIKDSTSVDLSSITTASQVRTIYLEPEG